MISEHTLREKCSKAIAQRLAKRAQDYVTEDMVKSCETLMEAQADFYSKVEHGVYEMTKR